MLCINQTAVHVKLNDIKVQQTTELNEMSYSVLPGFRDVRQQKDLDISRESVQRN